MALTNQCILSIAGFDPSGGAGILADIKTFEANRICGMGVISALTMQNDIEFDGLVWIDATRIIDQIHVLAKRFSFPVIKIGLIKDLDNFKVIMDECLKLQSGCKIIWDPVIKASAGFNFHNQFKKELLFSVLELCHLVTPNVDEVIFLSGINDPIKASQELSKYCNVLLKGGHNNENPGTDYLFTRDRLETILPEMQNVYPKHGSGCVLSSAIAANLFKNCDLTLSCINAKKYVERFLSSNQTLLGTHYV